MPWEEAVMPTLTSSTGGMPALEQATGHAAHGAAVLQYEWHGVPVVAARGEYDMGSIAPLADALEVATRKDPKVILDASGVTFADSTFLNLLILTHQAGTLRVVAPSPQVQRLCEITGADSFLEIRGTLEDAVVS
ncbi:STAS domain-containing protein [Streptomyces sp. NPDC001480]|uniref:STAS domain-containing protein n=1 Tax=Streptomyces sp. NPDC001480 TaxID=3364577 RepID=UPI0036C7A941